MALQLSGPLDLTPYLGAPPTPTPDATNATNAQNQAWAQANPQSGVRGILGALGLGPSPLQQAQAQAQVAAAQQAAADQARARAQQQAADAAIHDVLTDPTPANVARAVTLNPEHAAALKQANDALEAGAQTTALNQYAAIHGRLASGDIAGAKALLQQHIDAAKTSGQDASADEAALAALDTPDGAKAALGTIGFKLASIVGPEKYAQLLGPEERAAVEAETERAHRAEENKPIAVAQGTVLVSPNGTPAGAAPPEASGDTQPVRPGRLDPVAFFNEFVAPHEGGLNPHDANGAPTNFGINQTANPGVDVTKLTKDQAAKIFAEKYFAQSGAANLPAGLAAVVADTAFINPSAAQRFLQESGGDPQKFMDLRDQWMHGMVARDPDKFGPYAHAWATRNRDLRAYAARADAGGTVAAPPAPPQETGAPTAQGAPGVAGGPRVLFSNPAPEKPTGHASTPQEIAAAGLPPGTAAWTDANGKPTPYAAEFQAGGGPALPAQYAGLTGPDLLKVVPPAQAQTVKALAEGRLQFPSGVALSKPYWQQMLALVGQYDPTFDQANPRSRAATRVDFTSGKSAQNITALNTVIGHLDDLDHSISGLNNTGFPLNNMAAHAIAGATGTDARIRQFETAKTAVANELTRVFRGTGGAEADIQAWQKQLDASSSPEALRSVVHAMAELINSRLEALGEQYRQGMGVSQDPVRLLTPDKQAVFNRMHSGIAPEEAGTIGNGYRVLRVH